MTHRIGTLGFTVAVLFATAANAQIASPPPTLQGERAEHLFSVPGVVNNGLATVFACTNVSSSTIIVGVEVFGADGAPLNDPSATSLSMGAGETVMFGTQLFAAFSVDSTLVVGIVHKGSARILATAKSGLACSAFVADYGHTPPVSLLNLTVVKKTTQQGD